MSYRKKLRRALEDLGMVEGLPAQEVCRRLRVANRTTDLGCRTTAFYLVEMDENDHAAAAGYGCLVDYAEAELGLDRRRVFELLKAGRRLRELTSLDRAFCRDEITWSHVLEVVRIAMPETELAWIEKAQGLTVRELRSEVAGRKPGDAPRDPKSTKATEEVRTRLQLRLGPVTREMVRVAQQKLSDERGQAATTEELLELALGLYMDFERDGEVEGWTRRDSSLYRIHLYPASTEDDAPLLVRTDDGLLPMGGIGDDGLIAAQRNACACCDGEHVSPTGDPIDVPTPEPMRKRVLARDGHRCRCCGRRIELHVHHIARRSEGGPTKVWNLISVCVRCHSLLHAGLLKIEGTTQKKAVFCDRDDHPVHRPGFAADPKKLIKIQTPVYRRRPAGRLRMDAEGRRREGRQTATLDHVPDTVNAEWWRRHEDLIQTSSRGLSLRRGPPRSETEEHEAAEPPPVVTREEAFGGLVGRDELVERLETMAAGARELGRPFPHTVFLGPPGVGKTTLAKGVASRFGAKLVQASGPMLQDTAALLRILATLGRGSMLFIDEIHAVPQVVLELLYQAMDEGCLSLTFQQGAREKAVTLRLEPFTLIAATTEPQKLPAPLKSRFVLREELDRPGESALAELIAIRAETCGMSVTTDAARMLAVLARGIPREALRLLETIRLTTAGRGQGTLDVAGLQREISALGFDERGLTKTERRCVEALASGPMSMARLARLVGIDLDTFAKEIEPELSRRGLIEVSKRGRSLGAGSDAAAFDTRHFKAFGRVRTSALRARNGANRMGE